MKRLVGNVTINEMEIKYVRLFYLYVTHTTAVTIDNNN